MAQDFEKLNIQWFPGHMTKTLRLMEKDEMYLPMHYDCEY